MNATPKDRCHVNAVCCMDAACQFYPVCNEADTMSRNAYHQGDQPLFTPAFLLVAGALGIVAAITLGLFLGGMFVAYYDGALTRTALATLRVLGEVGWGIAARVS